jgi:putative phosphoesterase
MAALTPMRIGMISDTHGFLDPAIPRLFASVDHILHAGDVGPQSLLNELENLAPVTAVFGNTDSFLVLNETEIVHLDGKQFLVQHIVSPNAPDESLQRRLARSAPDMIVFGHTHKPFDEVVNGCRFFNPGYAGRTRFGMPRTVAFIETDGGNLSSRFVSLD